MMHAGYEGYKIAKKYKPAIFSTMITTFIHVTRMNHKCKHLIVIFTSVFKQINKLILKS